ncbi:ribonuclease E inhibitor RraB [Permianibacter aggregans]|uniref:Regulator of ribonuclease activity B n=1 Tax=Permianibacter aggregans TaxID=1510150 RepID=A0A4R6UZD5_9GAMM|nr:ribonuclease E inhibitor RraB [Permianibacter aggregans]QGX40121.1 ribonuclease E inhibitor RraB [Permianibacter aggregans]TDQ49064.1 regulator of ribonuclease activity B [Permianibacter aggregans]
MKEQYKQQIELDKSTLRSLAEKGDDDQVVRLIDHTFTSDDEQKLISLSELLLLMDFSNLIIDKHHSGYFLKCTSIDCTDFHNITKTSILLNAISEEYSVHYDGWGCDVSN